MKKFKKVFALMLALACIMSLNASAFAMVAFEDDTIDYRQARHGSSCEVILL